MPSEKRVWYWLPPLGGSEKESILRSSAAEAIDDWRTVTSTGEIDHKIKGESGKVCLDLHNACWHTGSCTIQVEGDSSEEPRASAAR